jgi:hypothetical protein
MCRNGNRVDVFEEVMNIRILMRKKEMNILKIYAPQAGCSNEEKEEFEEILEDNASGEYIFIMGDFNAQTGKGRNGYKTIMGPHRDCNRNSEGENILDICNRNDWEIGNNWFQKMRSHRIAHYSCDGCIGTIIDYSVLTRNLWNILNDIKVTPSISLEGDHRILIANFRKEAEQRLIVYQEKEVKIWKLKEAAKKGQFQQLLRTKLPKHETHSLEEEWINLKQALRKQQKGYVAEKVEGEGTREHSGGQTK